MKNLFKAMILGLFLIGIGTAHIGAATPNKWQISGIITDKKSGQPIPGVAILLGEDYLWTISEADGKFSIEDIPNGEYNLKASCLGYVDYTLNIKVAKDINDIKITLEENSLALDEVVVTAQRAKDELSTSHQLSRDALNHLQMSNMSDITSLLPGGKTINPDLTKDKPFSLRQGASSEANAAFGTAVEVDGVRLGGNALFDGMNGTGTRNVAVENIESIEVITGVPSAEYGDFNSGLVKIHTRNGRTPVHVVFSVNPRTYQISASKGIDLQKKNGILNISAEWARATSNLVSPYEAYSRTGLSATYSNAFNKKLRFVLGIDGNLGGMNSKDDPDASNGSYQKAHDNSFRAHTNLDWMIHKPGITNLKFNASVNFHDKKEHIHTYESSASRLPAVHSEKEGYFIADALPFESYYSDRINDSKELNVAAAIKYEWNTNWKGYKSRLKAGLQYKANGNVGAGKYYLDPSLAENGYRPRPYKDYPFMHNLSIYAEERFTLPVGKTQLELMAGLRWENIFIKGTEYNNMSTLSPRLNLKWQLNPYFALRGGWGITEKLPSFYILYPEQEYRDMLSVSYNTNEGQKSIYYTQPYKMLHNQDLRWQRNNNSELGFDMNFGDLSISLVGYYNLTRNPFIMKYLYTPFAYNVFKTPNVNGNGNIEIDQNSEKIWGDIKTNENSSVERREFELLVRDTTFVGNKLQANGNDMHRAGLELTIDFPEIKAIRTSFRLDASYNWSKYINNSLAQIYDEGKSYISTNEIKPNRSYQYVGIYALGGRKSDVFNGKITHNLDANLTSITHIPQAKLIITCKLEVSFLRMTRNVSEYNGKEYAYNIENNGSEPIGGSIYDGTSYTAIRPIYYMDLEGKVHPFTDESMQNPALENLIIRSKNVKTFMQDGYTPYLSANISITKEIGKHVSLSFYANNFTNSRMASRSWATGMSTIFTPNFYYGLTCRLKF